MERQPKIDNVEDTKLKLYQLWFMSEVMARLMSQDNGALIKEVTRSPICKENHELQEQIELERQLLIKRGLYEYADSSLAGGGSRNIFQDYVRLKASVLSTPDEIKQWIVDNIKIEMETKEAFRIVEQFVSSWRK